MLFPQVLLVQSQTSGTAQQDFRSLLLPRFLGLVVEQLQSISWREAGQLVAIALPVRAQSGLLAEQSSVVQRLRELLTGGLAEWILLLPGFEERPALGTPETDAVYECLFDEAGEFATTTCISAPPACPALDSWFAQVAGLVACAVLAPTHRRQRPRSQSVDKDARPACGFI
jgi:hypothetical protein